ncbi:MoxR family ATPase [Treponema parvum]|uniref:MoxR family ATPase n=1 Tax=Treponema parvum TaxID=138851 RepID=A0A975F5E0_9SPIR|nr:MoxR family ATPase [Treponema parvum]QTQ14782.1 MoxR family ATPase [Treponema parvum]
MENNEKIRQELEDCRALIEKCRKEVSKRLIGQTAVVDGILTAFIAGGHVLLEGLPGLAKTLAVKAFSDVSGLDFKRVQFTPDLLPADVTGTLIYERSSGQFSVRKGPVFTNVLLADEINRAPAKVQSALLEAMAERQVTIGESTYPLPKPFFVLATQNPIEQEGTYNLPEAELDRFLLKIKVSYPSAEEECLIVKSAGKANEISIARVFTPESLLRIRSLLDHITCDDKIVEYIVSIVNVTRPSNEKKNGHISVIKRSPDEISRYISYGASPRAGIALLQCSKALALMRGRSFVLPEDVKEASPAVMRHRLVLSYEAAAGGVSSDDLIEKILNFMPLP